MPVFEQGYRRYVGAKSTGSRALLIAWQNVRTRMRWWSWLLLLALTCIFGPYAIYAVFVFVVTLGAGLFSHAQPTATPVPTVAFGHDGGFDLGSVLALVQSSPLTLVWELLDKASFASVVFPAVVAAGLLASDRRTGALQIYFARPVSRIDYLAGKMLAAAYFVALTTAVPCLLLWIELVAFGSSATYSWRTWVAPAVILGASTLYALWSVALVLSLSSVMRRPAIVAIVAIAVNLVLQGLGKILGETLDPSWSVMMPSRAVGALTAPMCGLDLPDWLNLPAAAGIGFVLPVSLLLLVWWRLRAVEVAT